MANNSKQKTIWGNLPETLHTKWRKAIPYGMGQFMFSRILRALLASPDLRAIIENPKAQIEIRIKPAKAQQHV